MLPLCAGDNGIIPAYAGSTAGIAALASQAQDHPRIRGEHVSVERAVIKSAGSSPHTRGAQVTSWRSPASCRIIPAYAGSTSVTSPSPRSARDHPRIRGEHSKTYANMEQESRIIPAYAGSTFAGFRGAADGVRIIPAYAGSTSAARKTTRPGTDHPRIRGEHAGLGLGEAAARGSSPHTRGAPRPRRRRGRDEGIIPAYAGSTRPRRLPGPGDRDHPRIRGEHPGWDGWQLASEGSSPHTRGALHAERPTVRIRGIIPAYAGSTISRRPRTRSETDHPRIRGEHPPV